MKSPSVHTTEWFKYPVLKDSECHFVPVMIGKHVIAIKVAQQQSVWVSGYMVKVSGLFANKNPSRRYGEYPTRGKAILETFKNIFGVLAEHRLRNPELKDMDIVLSVIKNRIAQQEGKQLMLFKF